MLARPSRGLLYQEDFDNLVPAGNRIGGVTTSQAKYVLWRSPDQRLRVEFPQALLEQIRAEVIRSAHAIPGAGAEIGGILLGTRLESLVRVLAWEPIECQRAFGPSFLLSGQDEDRLQGQLAELARRSDRTGLHAVGWYVSRLQGDLQPAPDHRRLHASHFLESQKLLVVCQPDLLGDVRFQVSARFENEDRLTTYPNPLVVEPAMDRAAGRRRPGADTNPALASRTSRWTRVRVTPREGYVPPVMPSAAAALTPEEPAPAQRAPSTLLATVAMLAATLLLFVAAGALWLKNQGQPPLHWTLQRLHVENWLEVGDLAVRPLPRSVASLRASASGGRLLLSWESAGLKEMDALSGQLEISTAQQVMRLPLSLERLRAGSQEVVLAESPRLVRLRYTTAGGRSGEETLRLGTAGAAIKVSSGTVGKGPVSAGPVSGRPLLAAPGPDKPAPDVP